MDQRERFPIMGDNEITWVPWRMLMPHERQAQRNHSQTLAELAYRGGLSPCEAVAVMEDRHWRKMPADEAQRELQLHVTAHLETCQ